MAIKPSGDNRSHVGLMALGAAGVAAAAAAGYFFFSPSHEKDRKALKAWAVKAKGDIMEKIEELPHIDAATYSTIVDAVLAKYAQKKKATEAEISRTGKELKRDWKEIVERANAPMRKPAKRVSAKKP